MLFRMTRTFATRTADLISAGLTLLALGVMGHVIGSIVGMSLLLTLGALYFGARLRSEWQGQFDPLYSNELLALGLLCLVMVTAVCAWTHL